MSGAWSFEFFYSLQFWGALLAVAALVRALGGHPGLRGAALLAASSALLLALPRFRPLDLALVWLLALFALGCSRALARGEPAPTPRRRALAAAGILGVLAFLALFKYAPLQAALLGPRAAPLAADAGRGPAPLLVLLGVSYFSFKAIHVIVESYRGALPRAGALTFLNYMTFFPAFVSGPINRYGDFSGQLEGRPVGTLAEDLREGGARIVDGLFKKLVLVPLIFPHVLTNLGRPLDQATALDVLLGLYATAIYFFLDFAGYSDLAIGGARLLGLRLPENFRHPFLQRNLRDLWANWHMTLTGWLVDYVYWPLVRRLRALEWFRTRPVALSVVGMIVTFLCCGIWHGEAPHFLLWGAWHGLGIAALTVYQRQKRRLRSPAAQRWFASRPSRWLGTLGTFQFFAAGLALFVLDLDQLGTLLAAVFR